MEVIIFISGKDEWDVERLLLKNELQRASDKYDALDSKAQSGKVSLFSVHLIVDSTRRVTE